MDKRLLKRVAALGLAVGLSMFQAAASFAADVSPECYVFSLVLRSCGISASGEVGQWLAAYEGYLEAAGDQAMLQKLKGYSGLSWGSAAEGTDDLYWSVRDWLSKGVIREGTDSNGNCLYSMPSCPDPLPSSSLGVCGIQGAPFSDVKVPSDVSGYVYAFSDSYSFTASSGRILYVRRNIYAPAGMEIFGITTSCGSYSSSGGVTVTFYTPDKSASQGYRPVSFRSIATSYYLDTGAVNGSDSAFSATVSYCSVGCRSVMNFPFKVFSNVSDGEAYCKTGVYKDHAYFDGSMALWARGPASGSDHSLLDKEIKSVGDSIRLPASSSAGASSLAALRKPLEPGSLSSALSDAGMEVSYVGSYKVEHYKRDVSDMDAPVTWIKESEESLSGIAGQPAFFTPKSYPHFLYSQEFTEPKDAKILGDGSLVVRLYYEPDPDAEYSYSVEYYKDGELFETVSGTVPVFGERIVRECEDFCPQYYLPDVKASTPLPFEVTDEKNVIHVYYKRDFYAVFPYTVEYYQDGELFKAIPASVSVFDPSVKSCVSYCPRGYVLDTTASTSLPYEVSADGGVVRNYYVRKDTVIPYTVEYYRDGLRKNTYSGNVPASSPVVQSCPSYCPEYYKIDAERSDSFPYTLSEGTSRNRIRIFYKKDEDAVFPYTVECYKDGQLVETASKTISVFHPAVKEYGFDCPEGYVVDTSSSTSLPYSVSKDSNVIKYYYVDEGKTLPYTVEYHRDGKIQMTLTGNVPVTSPEVKQYWPYSPSGYLLDEEASDTLPFTVTRENNVIHAYYVPDPANPYASFVSGVKTMMNSVAAFLKGAVWWLILLVILVIFCDRNMVMMLGSKEFLETL